MSEFFFPKVMLLKSDTIADSGTLPLSFLFLRFVIINEADEPSIQGPEKPISKRFIEKVSYIKVA